jgi:hypothetical protein
VKAAKTSISPPPRSRAQCLLTSIASRAGPNSVVRLVYRCGLNLGLTARPGKALPSRSSGFAVRPAVERICSRTAFSETNGLLNRTSTPSKELTPTPGGAPIGLAIDSVENSPSTATADSRLRTEKHTRSAQLSRVLVGMLSAVGLWVLRITRMPADLPRLTKSRTTASISAPTAPDSCEGKTEHPSNIGTHR